MQHPTKIRLIEPLVIFLLLSAAIIYLVNVFNTGNWLWFQSRVVNVRPSRIVIINRGERVLLTPGHADFQTLADAAAASLSELNSTDLISIGLSEETLQDYATKSLVLELYFDSPVQFNTLARTGEPTQLLIPITGRHANGNYVFRGARGEWWFGAVRMANATPLYSTLEQMGYTAASPQPASY